MRYAVASDYTTAGGVGAGARVLLFGAGSRGRMVLEELQRRRPDVRVTGFLDSHRGGTLEGLPVTRVEQCGALAGSYDTVLIATLWWREAAAALRRAGVAPYAVFFPEQAAGPPLRHAVLSRSRRWMQLVVPKAAARTVMRALRFDLQDRDGEPVGDVESLFVDAAGDEYRDYFKFAFVRNPWDRLVSCYEDKYNPDDRDSSDAKEYAEPLEAYLGVARVSFREFLEFVAWCPDSLGDGHWVPQTTLLSDTAGRFMPDFVGRIEELHDDFGRLCEILGVNNSLGWVGRSHRRLGGYRNYYDDAGRAIVERRFAADIERFGYRF